MKHKQIDVVVPNGWIRTTIGDIGSILSGYGFPITLQGTKSGDLPFYKVGDISQAWLQGERNLTAAHHYLSIEDAKKIRATPLPQGTVVFAKIGEAIRLNRRSILSSPALVDNNVIGIWVNPILVSQEYLFYYMCTVTFGETTRASVVPSLRKSDIEDVFFNFPPLAEQRRIVAKIDELFSDLDAGVAALERVKANLIKYRASVLKAAVEGKLTEAWRKDHPESEPASKLLERILTERRRKWEEEQLKKYADKGQAPPTGWRDKYKDPAKPDTSNLPALPDGWCWATSDQLFEYVTSGSRGWAQYYSTDGSLFLRIGNLDHGCISLDLSDMQRVKLPEQSTEGLRTRVRCGDILISITADVGMIAVVDQNIGEAYVNQHISLARPVEGMSSEYMGWVLASEHGGQRQFRRMQRGATKTGLSLDDIRAVSIPLPSMLEQEELVSIINDHIQKASSAEKQIEIKIKRTVQLRQSILRRAFSGQLVPQDPNDESACILLERIKAERQSIATVKPSPRKRKKVDRRHEV